MLTRTQAEQVIQSIATASADERIALLRRLLAELPPDLWPVLGPAVVVAATLPPGEPGRAEMLRLIGLMPGTIAAAVHLLIEVALDPDDPDQEVAQETWRQLMDRLEPPRLLESQWRTVRPGGRTVPAAPAAPESAAPPGYPPVPADTVYPRLDAPEQVAPGEEFTVTVGLRNESDEALLSTGKMTLPSRTAVEVQVSLQFDPQAFLMIGPGAPGPTPGTWSLHRTADDPLPSIELQFIARAGDQLSTERRISASFLRGGQLLGFASRAIRVASPQSFDPQPDSPSPAGTSLGHDQPVVVRGRSFRSQAAALVPPAPAPPPIETLDPVPIELTELAPGEIADLVVVIQSSAEIGGTRMVFTAYSRHADIADRDRPLTEVIVGEHRGGTTPQQLGRQARLKVSTTKNELELFVWLQGMGDRIHRSFPPAIRAALRQAVAKGTPEAPASILLLSDEPYIPWELAVNLDGWPSKVGGTSNFLGAHATISRWILSDLPPPAPRPPASVKLRRKALVTAHYQGLVGWEQLPQAEAEVARLATALAPGVTVVPPAFTDVLRLLGGDPPADLLHFALHGTFDPAGLQDGLVLVGVTPGGMPVPQLLQENQVRGQRMHRAPFVYLNACQVAAGDSQTLGDYGGLAAAFLVAGASGVLAPLWNVADGTASRLASEFYALAQSADPPSAAEIVRRFRARYTRSAIDAGGDDVNATLVAFQLFGHPQLRLDLTGADPDHPEPAPVSEGGRGWPRS